jgi:nucleoid-associated protein YgaU
MPQVDPQVMVQHGREASVPKQFDVVLVEVVGEVGAHGPPGPVEGGQGGGVPTADGVDGIDRWVAVERVSGGGEQRGVETVRVGDLVNRPSRGQAPQCRRNPISRSSSPRNTLRLTVTRTVPGPCAVTAASRYAAVAPAARLSIPT